ncbi:phosphatase PAP2 family protein [Paenibacillus lacisoli]|nr:phosphatase PAP2 family protein [Paenibacillus sp. JX-17]
MTYISIYTSLVVVLLLWLGSMQNPFKAAWIFVKELIFSRKFLILFAAMVCVLLMNKYELQFENAMKFSGDFTPDIFGLEGRFVHHFQQLFYTPWLTPILVFFYIVVFQTILISSVGIYAAKKNWVWMYGTCYAVIINYLVAIPFYLFFPVNEVWHYAPAQVTFHMLDAFPAFEEIYRPLSGLNNCFPSLHTAISVTVSALAIRSGVKSWSIIAPICGVIIVFSIFYLGVHWLSDMLAGLVLGLTASTLGLRLARRTLRNDHRYVDTMRSGLNRY